MSRGLKEHLSSSYFEAANRMTPKKARRRIVAYVESYDDIFFGAQCWAVSKTQTYISR